jgi:arylsulfatase A-like enzyme
MSQSNAQADERPNVLWLFGDQHRAQALSCNGDPNVNTPNVDRLAAQGVNFDRAVCGFPLCCPFRGSLLTSRYPHECVPGHEYQMPPEQPTVAHVFNDAGYATAYFGKWHVDGFHESKGRAAMHIVPPERRGGFQLWIGYENNNSQWDSWVHGGEGGEAFHYRLPGYETNALTDLLLDYLRRRGTERKTGNARPFFAALSVQPPHDPYVAPEEYQRRHNPARLTMRPNVPRVSRVEETARRQLAGAYAQIENWDANVGRILRTLDETGLAFNTHVVFFSDHGDLHGSHGHFRKTAPYEESLRIPFIIGGERPMAYDGRRTGRPAVPLNHVDIAPTTLGLCGISVPGWMRGTNYARHRLRDATPAAEPDSAFIQSVVSTGHAECIDKPWRGLVTKDGWKYACFEGVSWLLFNLNEDPYEQINLAHYGHFAAERNKLIARLKQWIADTGDRFAVPDA